MKRLFTFLLLSGLFFTSFGQADHEALLLKPQKVDEASHPNLVYLDADKTFRLPADGAFLYSSLEGETGIVASGYNNNEDHTVTIRNDYGRRIFLKSQYFLANNGDYLRIYDGPDTNAALVKVLTGVLDKNFLMLSTGEYLTIRFKSDNQGTSRGFRFRLDNGPGVQGRPAPPLPNPMACASTPAADECANSPLICDLNGYCGNTSGSYTAGNTSGLGNFCGSIENNSWLSFVASGTSASLAFTSGGCQDNSSGIQAVIYASSNCTSFTEVSNCESQGSSSGSFTITTNVNLVPGQTYYVMIDGFAGNICSYTVAAQAGVALGQQITGASQVCPGYSTTLGSSSTASSYSWTSTPPGTYPNTQTITVSPTVTTTYTLTLGPSACTPTGAVVVKTVTVTNTLNPANITAPSPICMGSNITLSSLTNGGTYSWTGPAGFTGSTQNVTVNNWTTANNGVYNLTINYGPGCATAPATVNLTGTPSPTINLSVAPSLTICSGQSVTMTASGGTGTNGYTWNWNLFQTSANTQFCVSIPFLGTTCNNMPFAIPGMAAGPNATFTPSQSTQICVSSENAAGCPGNKCVNIVVLPAASGLTVSPTSTICPGQSTTLTVSGGSTYTWSPAGSLSSANGATVTASPTITTTYTVSTPGCSSTQTKTLQVVVNGVPPAIGAISGPTLVCANSTGLTYSVNNVAATNYTWTVPSGASITAGAGSNAITVNFGATAGTVSVTAAGSCGTATAALNVSLSPALNLTVTPASSNVCAGGTVTLTASGATNYTWSPAASLNTASGSSVIASPTTATTYTVIGATGTCTGSATANISIGGGLSLTVSANTPTVCPGASALLSATGANSYTWAPASSLSAPTGTGVTATPPGSTIYTVTGSTGGCTGTATVAVNVTTVGCIPTSCDLAAIRSALTSAGNIELLGMDNTCSLYFINPQYMSGPQAQAYAQTFGANLISVQSASENADLLQALSNQGYTGQVIWIGFSDALLEGTFVWYDGAPVTYSNWAPGEPNNSGGNENCTQIYPDGTWNDLNCTGYNSLSVIEVNLCPQVSIGAVAAHCPNTNVVLNASTLLGSPSYTYTWVQSGSETFTNTSTPGNTDQITVTSAAANTFTVYSQDRYSCPQSASITLTVLPTPTVTANSATICAGQQSATLTASGASSYTWAPAATLSASTGNSVTATPASTTSYTISGSDANGCVGTATNTVTVVNLPSLTVPANATICPAASTTLTAGGASSYTWSPAGGLSSANGASVAASPASTTVYTITGANSSGCTSTGTVQVTAASNPTVTATADATICPGSSATFTASGATSYTWAPAASLNNANQAVVSATPAANTTYTVTGADANGCVNTGTVTASIAPNPTLTASASTTICPAGSSTLTVSGATSYTWSPAVSLNTANSATVTATPAASTTYTISGANATGCAGTTTVMVTVTPNPTLTVSPNATVCPNSLNTLTVSGAASYTWSPTTFLSGSQFLSSVISTPTASTTYTVTGLTGICSSTAAVTLAVSNTVVVNAATATPTICPMGSATLTASGASTYTWSPAITLNTNTGGTVTATPPTSQTYTVIGATGTCTNSAQVAITVTTNPTIVAPAAGPICKGESASLSASGAASYSWTPATGLSATSGSTVTANPGSTTTYSVIGVSPLGCINFTTVTLNVIPIPVISITSSSMTICEGDSPSLNAYGSSTGSYTWAASPGSVGTPTANPISVSPTVTTTYTVVGTNGVLPKVCPSAQQITINVIPRTRVVAPSSLAICYGSSAMVAASGGNTYSWAPATGLTQPHDSITFVSPPASTVYTVTVSNNGLCPGTATLDVTVNPLPYVYAGRDTVVNIDEYITLNGTGTVDVGFLPPTATPLNCNFCNSIVVNPQESTCYVLMGTNQYGCVNTDTVCVTVTRDWNVYIPNAFTPNSDNTNDVFIPVGYGLSEITLTIFNRWGSVIFRSNGDTVGWDGTSKGKLCEQGVYIYQADITTMGGDKVKRTGHVTLLSKIR